MSRAAGGQREPTYRSFEGASRRLLAIGDRIDPAPLDHDTWDLAIAGFFRSYRAVFAAHPRVVPLLTTATIRAPEVIEAYDRMVTRLTEGGIPTGRAIEILTVLEDFVIGSALDLAPEVMWEIPDGVDAPHLAAAVEAQDSAVGRAERSFEVGLRMFLDGVRGEAAGTA